MPIRADTRLPTTRRHGLLAMPQLRSIRYPMRSRIAKKGSGPMTPSPMADLWLRRCDIHTSQCQRILGRSVGMPERAHWPERFWSHSLRGCSDVRGSRGGPCLRGRHAGSKCEGATRQRVRLCAVMPTTTPISLCRTLWLARSHWLRALPASFVLRANLRWPGI